MTNTQASNTFLFDFIKSEMVNNNTTELTQDILNSAYRKSVAFLSNESNLNKIKNSIKNTINN